MESPSETFLEAQMLHHSITNTTLASNDKKYQDQLQHAYNLFLRVDKWISSAKIFSPNETIDDVSSVDLKYCLTPFYLGDLGLAFSGIEFRLGRIKKSMLYLTRFLDHCEQLEVMKKEDASLYHRGGEIRIADPRNLRAYKIAQYKRGEETKKKIEHFLKKKKELQKKGINVEDEQAEHDEVEHKYLLALIDQSITKSIEHIKFSKQELQFLEHRKKMMNSGKSGKQHKEQKLRKEMKAKMEDGRTRKPKIYHIPTAKHAKLPIPQHMKDVLKQMEPPPVRPQGKLSIPRNLSSQDNNEQDVYSQVLKQAQNLQGVTVNSIMQSELERKVNPGKYIFRNPNPPTMDLDQWVDIQQEKGILPKPQKPQYVPNRTGYIDDKWMCDLDEGDEEPEKTEKELEEELYKARDWDNWKDDHEKGIGNSMK